MVTIIYKSWLKYRNKKERSLSKYIIKARTVCYKKCYQKTIDEFNKLTAE